MARGACAGFEVRSTLPFATLRSGSGTPLEVVHDPAAEAWSGEPILAWRARPDNPFEGRLHRDGDTFGFWASDAGWYAVDPTRPAIAIADATLSQRRELRLFGVPASICALVAGDLSVHAAAVEVHGQAVLLGGPSRSGKTTLAAAIARAGHRLLAEDTTRCTLRNGPHVYPGPAALRLRADVASWAAMPGTRLDSLDTGRVPVVIPEPDRGTGDPVPLRAIVLLHEGVGVGLERVSPISAARDLFALTFHLPDRGSRAAVFERLVDLVTAVEVFDLRRPKTPEAVPAVVARLEALVGESPSSAPAAAWQDVPRGIG